MDWETALMSDGDVARAGFTETLKSFDRENAEGSVEDNGNDYKQTRLRSTME